MSIFGKGIRSTSCEILCKLSCCRGIILSKDAMESCAAFFVSAIKLLETLSFEEHVQIPQTPWNIALGSKCNLKWDLSIFVFDQPTSAKVQ